MKNLLFTLSTLFITSSLLIFSGCKSENPEEYNNALFYYYSELNEQLMFFEEAIWDETYDTDELEYQYNKTLDIYKTNIDSLKNFKALEKDPGLKTAIIEFYEISKSVLDNEFKKIIDMYNSEWDDSYADLISKLDKDAIDKLAQIEQKISDTQEKFAEQYELTITSENKNTEENKN